MLSNTPAYDALADGCLRLHRLTHFQNLAHWDQATWMPPGGNQARSEALAELAAVLHRLRTDEQRATWLDQAATEALDDWQAANLREIRRDYLLATALPPDLVERRAMVTGRSEHAWREQRAANDWSGFLPNLREVVAVAREEAQLLSQRMGVSAYDALLDQYEPGMRSAEVRAVFAQVSQWLPGLVRQVLEKQAGESLIRPEGPFPIPAQRALCEQLIRRLGFDFESGRLDVSTHPFSGGVPEDVRLTTRFRDSDFLLSLMSSIHETGHGRYEQNLPRAWLGQPVALARSMAFHESQSLSFEMQLGSHLGFAQLLSPLLAQTFGDQAAFEPGNLHRLFTRVQPGLIRVEADELTYPAHVILRFEIEHALIEGEIEAEDIPALWDQKMASLLGQDTRGNFRDGPMQDIHWPSGLFGYFPCYSLGAMYAAQWFAAMRRELPDLDEGIAQGRLEPVFDWLNRNIWSQGSRWLPDELALRASGERLNPEHLRRHLTQRYLGA